MDFLVEILKKLISYPSLTPNDAGCQEYMMQFLTKLGFKCQTFNQPPVNNFYAQLGDAHPLLIFAGHTDVVPVGDENQWNTNPFELHEKNGMLYGRGTADMKGSLACMLVAASRFVEQCTHFKGSLGFLITSAEEGDHYNLGTPYVMQQLETQGIRPDFCVVGEPSSTQKVGDVIKIGRRGSLTGELKLHGKQGHVAYPHLAENPIHKIASALAELTDIKWDNGNIHFPPTSFQITHIHAGGQANNIIPGDLTLHFNLRYSTKQTAEQIKQTIQDCFARHHLYPQIHWRLSGEPFLTSNGQLLEKCIEVIQSVTQNKPELSTSGGTSDGRFIAPYGIEVIELGPVNATIHQVNECVSKEDLFVLTDIYFLLIKALLTF